MANPLLDWLLPLLRIPYFWAPVYLFLLVWMYMVYKKAGLVWCLFFFVTFVFCDYISAHFIKAMVQRVRPCNDEALAYLIRRIVQCGSGYSFPSSHAANHVGLSFFMIFTLGKKYKYLTVLVLLWAFSVCFAQVYCGVHYPFDIVAGGLMGVLIARMTAAYFHHKVQLN
jgi:undecaprenyl-diphosphatase